jgi:hypothetical protein
LNLEDDISRGLIIAEPWIGKILRGEKVWEMRSKKTNIRGVIGLIRKGSGKVVGIARITDASGPYSKKELFTREEFHHVPAEMINEPDYKWNCAWHLSDVIELPQPIPYTHKSGAVTWVSLDPEVTSATKKQFSAGRVLSEEKSQSKSEPAESLSIDDEGESFRAELLYSSEKLKHKSSEPVVNEFKASKRMVLHLIPISKDGSRFDRGKCLNANGFYTVGHKCDQEKFADYTAALEFLRRMDAPKWRRPNAKGNWGIVTGVDWVSAE